MTQRTELATRAHDLFTAILGDLDGRPALTTLREQVAQDRDLLDLPLRVAIVGRIKAGKSTLLNALLGDSIVVTGPIETTFNVNWLRHGGRHALHVHFRDGRCEERAYHELASLTAHNPHHLAFLRSIDYIVVEHPSPLLRCIELIDTPGLESSHDHDSRNTLRVLGFREGEIDRITASYASKADAVLFLFRAGLSTGDQAMIAAIEGPVMGQTSPLKAIGVLTQTDAFWPADDPLQKGHEIATRLTTTHPQVRQRLHALFPVAGLLAFGAQTLRADEQNWLSMLASLQPERLAKLLRSEERFATRNDPDVAVTPVQRQFLLDRLGSYGVAIAVEQLRQEGSDPELLRTLLYHRSGMPALMERIIHHFGRRALLIKLNTSLQRLRVACLHAQQRHDGADRTAVARVADRIERFAANEQAFQELEVLNWYYEGRLPYLSETEQEQLLRVTGEHGEADYTRLGRQPEDDPATLLATAEGFVRAWNTRAIDRYAHRDTARAARILVRSYEELAARLRVSGA